MNKNTRKPKEKNDLGRAAPALKKNLVAALTDASVEYSVVDVWSDERFEKINESIGKYCGRWLSSGDINGIIINSVFAHLRAINAMDAPLQLANHLNAGQIAEIADEIITFLKTIPRSYEILFPLPHLKQIADFTLSGPVSFTSRPFIAQGHVSRPLTLADIAAQGIAPQAAAAPLRPYMKIKASGYADTSRTVSAMHEAMAVLKRTIQVGITKKVFHRKRHQGGIIASALRGHDEQPIMEALVYDVAATGAMPKVVKLGLGMSNYLNEIIIRDLPSSNGGAPPDATVEQYLLANLHQPVEVLTTPMAADDSAALRSAFEWAFDAAADDEAIGGCIKTCIALEAALGEDSDERGITERMADRVAYVIGKSPSDRKTFREYMREFYKLRSSLVHGKQAMLNPQDHAVDSRGRAILEMVLNKELNAIETWWRRRRAPPIPISEGTPPS